MKVHWLVENWTFTYFNLIIHVDLSHGGQETDPISVSNAADQFITRCHVVEPREIKTEIIVITLMKLNILWAVYVCK